MKIYTSLEVRKDTIMTDELIWTNEAEERLTKIPFFVRKMAKSKIEQEAIKSGETTITVELMKKIKEEEHS